MMTFKKKTYLLIANFCDVCETKEAKYRCPSCRKHTHTHTLSLSHTHTHTYTISYDKTAFVPLAEFNEINLLNDYRFLEDTARLTQQSNRDGILKSEAGHMWSGCGLNSVFWFCFCSEGRFYWHLKIHFPQSDAVYSERYKNPSDFTFNRALNVFGRYPELDLKKTLQENLMHKTIVEYPEVFVQSLNCIYVFIYLFKNDNRHFKK
uniref:BCD1 alpha/beta domain-containing protein n=1 Tax=Cyprinus carpio TaxID=7962 RepID=A0A8C1X9Y4_CYPCA